MKVRKLLATDIGCRTCNAASGEPCDRNFLLLLDDGTWLRPPVYDSKHGERIAEHAELERAGWSWQEVNPTDAGSDRDTRNRGPK